MLLYFKVHLEGLSNQAQVQVLLQVNKRLLIVCRITTAHINLATKLLCYLLIHQGSQQKDVSTAADDVRTSAGAKSQNHL